MIWHIDEHEIALVGAGHAYEDLFEPFLRLVCITCWEDPTGTKDFILWEDPDALNPEEEDVPVDYERALTTLASHLAPQHAMTQEVVEAAITVAALADSLGPGIEILRESAPA